METPMGVDRDKAGTNGGTEVLRVSNRDVVSGFGKVLCDGLRMEPIPVVQ